MKRYRKIFSMLLSFVMIFSSLGITAFGEGMEETEGQSVIKMNSSSDWQGSIFGDVGGADKITYENFEITENEDKTVTLRSSNDKGKISSTSEGIAYYFKELPKDVNFEFTTTAYVYSFKRNDQVSFGIMLRNGILNNESQSAYTDNYIAVGPIRITKEPAQKAFYKVGTEAYQKINMNTKIEPMPGDQMDISIKKSGDIYTLKYGNEEEILDASELELFTNENLYVGLFTARNATIIYKNTNLKIEGEVDLGDWNFKFFGGNTGEEKNPNPIINADDSIALKAINGGKIASDDEGISFFYKELPVDANFAITTTATVDRFPGDHNQQSFGLMLKDVLGEGSKKQSSNYVAIGALDKVMKPFYKKDNQTKGDAFAVTNPQAGEVYQLKIKKAGNTYVLTCNEESETITIEDVFTDNIFAGLYVAREADVTFSDFDIQVDARTVSTLRVDTTQMQTKYLQYEDLNISGLKVTAIYSDGTEEVLTEDDYIVTGFDSSEVGTNTIKINYNGAVVPVDLTIQALSCTSLDIKYLPIKTEYYMGDTFDVQGFVVVGTYNDGYLVKELTNDLYEFYLGEEQITEDTIFTESGSKEITVKSVETPKTRNTFMIEVKNAELLSLEIRKNPSKMTYFIDDPFDPTGMSVYAKYSDNTEVRLMNDEYEISELDSTTSGEKEIMITHKNKTIPFVVTVKEKEVMEIEVTKYPKTTYVVGEDLDFTDLEISKVYDNGDRELLDSDQYTMNSSAYKKDVEGIYTIQVQPQDVNIKAITFPVMVRKKADQEWKSIVFGQSINKSKNFIEKIDDNTIRLVALEGGGKVTGDHDGISFYYTELDAVEDNFILSADIKVEAYAKTPHDGQESFGIMARDAIGTDLDSSVFASNIAAIGGFSGGTKDENGTQLFVRTGVGSSDGAGSQGIQKIMLKKEKPTSKNTYPTKDYKLTLAKTNSGFVGKLNDGAEEILYTPDILNVQDGKMYVGFYAARLATIEVSNVNLVVTAAKVDPPKVEPPVQPIEPSFEFISPTTSSTKDYHLMVQSNVDGSITIKQENQVIALEKEIKAGQRMILPVTIKNQDSTNFSGSFLPDDTAYLTSYDQLVQNFTVEMKTFREGKDIYVSTTGKSIGTGSKDNPLDLDTAITFVQAGQKIIMLEGTYNRNTSLNIKKYNDGTKEAKKYLWADEGAKVVIDFNKKSEGGLLSGDYWHIKGIDFTKSAGNTKGFTVGGNHNIVELCNFYNNGDTGLQISRTDSANAIEDWPSYNLILNCTSHDNSDPSQNNADGFGAKLTTGVGNVFDGCISYHNVDDGWDLYTKAGSGAIGAVVIKNSITYGNGRLSDGKDTKGDGNGFKLGGEGIHVPHVIENCLAFDNEAYGFTSNSNPGVIARNNISFNNIKGNADFRTYVQITPDFTMDRFISYQKDYTAKDIYPEILQSDKNFMFDGKVSQNKSGTILTDQNFVSLEKVIPYEREDNGNIIWGDFLKFIAPESELVIKKTRKQQFQPIH